MSRLVVALVPAYNEESHIASVLSRLMRQVDMVIVCDDGSTDLTGEIAEAMGATVVRHDHNMGYGAALRSLFKAALEIGADVAVTIDADGQHDPGEVGVLVEAMDEGYDVVIGSRFLAGDDSKVPGWRKRGIDVITRLSGNGARVSDSQSGFRAYSRGALESLRLSEDGMGVSTEILLKAGEVGLKVGEVPVSVRYLADSSTYNPLVHGFGVLFSTIRYLSMRRPLLFFGVPGLVLLVFGVYIWVSIFSEYSLSGVFSNGLAVASLAFALVGLSLLTASLIIWVVLDMIGDGC
jgi:glycosyltransferase involved in cell wall biosynthesis